MISMNLTSRNNCAKRLALLATVGNSVCILICFSWHCIVTGRVVSASAPHTHDVECEDADSGAPSPIPMRFPGHDSLLLRVHLFRGRRRGFHDGCVDALLTCQHDAVGNEALSLGGQARAQSTRSICHAHFFWQGICRSCLLARSA